MEAAKRQVAPGANNLTVAMIAEAELMSGAGIRGVLWTKQPASQNNIYRSIALSKRDPSFLFVTDSLEVVDWVEQAAAASKVKCRAAVSVYASRARQGIEAGQPALALTQSSDLLRTSHSKGTWRIREAPRTPRGFEACCKRSSEDMAGVRETIELSKKCGLPVNIASGGSTGTYNIDHNNGLTELEAGSYVFMDTEYWSIGGKDGNEVYSDFSSALTVLTTVDGKLHPNLVTTDYGNKAMARVTDRVKGKPWLEVGMQGAEYGALRWKDGSPGLKLEDRVEIYPTNLDVALQRTIDTTSPKETGWLTCGRLWGAAARRNASKLRKEVAGVTAAALLVAAIAWAGRSQSSNAWVGAWASAQQIPEPRNALSAEDLRDATLRQIVHLAVGGGAIRVHVSNAFGLAPLHLASIHVAHSARNTSAAIDPATDKALTFAGRTDVTVPARAEYISDPIDYPVMPGMDLAISIHFDDPPQQETGHPGSRATSYLIHGDFASAADLPKAKRIEHWYQLSGVDVVAAQGTFAIVVLGDSITDGHASTTNGNDRWTDVLARRIQRAGFRNVGVLNEGIGGNHLLTDGLGPNALARFDRDVLAQTAVREVIVLEGINDLGGLARTQPATAAEHAALVQQMIGAYEQIITRAHAKSIRVIGGTIMPDGASTYYHPDAASEADRQAVNAWIRTPGHFDAVVDFDKVMRDPKNPRRLLSAFDCGDHLHPSPAGYAAMANAVPFEVLQLRWLTL